MEFLSPLLTEDIEILSRPASTVTYAFKSAEGKRHEVSLYFDCSAERAVNTTDQKVVWSRHRLKGLGPLSFASLEQPVLKTSGDDRRIDWGRMYLAVPKGQDTAICTDKARGQFAKTGAIPAEDDLRMPRRAGILPAPASGGRHQGQLGWDRRRTGNWGTPPCAAATDPTPSSPRLRLERPPPAEAR